MPRAPNTAYLMRCDDGQYRAVVPDPYDSAVDGRSARYLVTNACVVLVACPYCDAEVGKPCLTARGNACASVHADRGLAARAWKKRWPKTWATMLERAALSMRLSIPLLQSFEESDAPDAP